jgi:arylsulfatase A-like enzyme
MEPHSPYDPPEPFRARFLREGDDQSKATAVNEKLARFEVGKITPSEDRLLESLYDGEVAAMDSELQAFFAELEKRELLKNAIVVVTSDHGEEFRDHGGLAHGNSLYNETIRVPLIIVGPGVVGGRVVDENVSLVDIAPTLLDLLDLPPEPLFEGRSLAALLKGSAAEAPTDVVSELLPKTVGRSDFRRHEYSLVRSSWKLLVSPRKAPETYNLATDPHEEDAVSLQGGESAKLQAALDRTIDRLAQSKSEQESTQLDAATQEKLRQLGYGH